MQNKRRNNQYGITLIALVITIIVLLILARSNNKYTYRRKWYTTESFASKNKQLRITKKGNCTTSNTIRNGCKIRR
jgi:hypothetical protein